MKLSSNNKELYQETLIKSMATKNVKAAGKMLRVFKTGTSKQNLTALYDWRNQ